VGANDRVGMRQQRFFGGIAADHGEPGELPEGGGTAAKRLRRGRRQESTG